MDCGVVTHRGHSSQETPISLWRNVPMCCMRFTISASYRKEIERHLKTAQRLGHVRQVKYLLAILAVGEGQSFAQVALVLHVHEKTVATWVRICCVMASRVLRARSPQGARPNSLRRRKPHSPRSLTRGRARRGSAVPADAPP